jgi:hypothetical protein
MDLKPFPHLLLSCTTILCKQGKGEKKHANYYYRQNAHTFAPVIKLNNMLCIARPSSRSMLDPETAMERLHTEGNAPIADNHGHQRKQCKPGKFSATPAEGYP